MWNFEGENIMLFVSRIQYGTSITWLLSDFFSLLMTLSYRVHLLTTVLRWSMPEYTATLICLRLGPHSFHEKKKPFCFIVPLLLCCCPHHLCLSLDYPLQIVSYADKFQNKAILLIHFSARYTPEVSFLTLLNFLWVFFF